MRVGDSWRKLASSDLAVLVLWATAEVLLHTVTNGQYGFHSDELARRRLAVYGRRGLLSSLAALAPWFAALTVPASLVEVAAAMDDVSRCWP